MSNGLDDFAHNPEMRVALREPFPPHLISKIPKGGRTEDYVGHAVVTDRLNAVCPGWTMSEPQFIKDEAGHISGVLCSMTIGNVTRWEVGDCDQQSKPGAEAKIALSDWVKRAAMRFGVGIDLWSKENLQYTSPTTAQPTASKPQSRLGDGAVTSHEAPTGDGAAVSVAVVTDLGSAADSNASQTTGKVSNSAGETPADPVPLPVVTDVPEKLASDEQWRRLLDVCDQSKQRAVNKINKANGTHYTIATATEGATWAELVKAMT